MRHLTNIFVILLSIILLSVSADAAIKGGLEYNIPIDYSQLNEQELSNKADSFYSSALITSNGKVNEDVTTALNLYNILANKNPQNQTYPLRAGKLYDIIGKDRYAKGNYYRAMGINSANPEPYFFLGEYFYNRKQYRRALKFYKEAYNRGYASNPETLSRLNVINKKLASPKSME